MNRHSHTFTSRGLSGILREQSSTIVSKTLSTCGLGSFEVSGSFGVWALGWRSSWALPGCAGF